MAACGSGGDNFGHFSFSSTTLTAVLRIKLKQNSTALMVLEGNFVLKNIYFRVSS